MKEGILKKTYTILFLVLGNFLTAYATIHFLLPAKISPGGVSGIATIVFHLFNISPVVTTAVINIPLILISMKMFGKRYGYKTILSIGLLIFFTYILMKILGTEGILHESGKSGDLMLPVIYGGIISGIGVGLVIKVGGSTGGTVIVASIINKLFRIPIGSSLALADLAVVLAAAFSMGVEIALYSIICLFITGRVVNVITEGESYAKMVYIISDKYLEIKKVIITDMELGGTVVKASGMFTDDEKKMIITVVHNRKLSELKSYIKEIDKEAFVIIAEADQVLGEGFIE
ncbi:YitT family protein [Sebaldella sp. S0638]|uniref:YitT family protein n=1 Tax=Sebaldella sp. S0638 TaxID=2957809 RepID=UPI00209C8BDB|nr:YitT family protein [Sebaldella sp. S0638]MCP1226373.1 YitT family protein [Sebaldella sp. S0638]